MSTSLKTLRPFYFLLIISILILLSSCKQFKDPLNKENRPESAADDLEGAMLYEFNMTKDPATGKIPEGIRARELAQANDILRQQQSDNIITVGTYSYVGPNNLGGRTRALAYDVRYDGVANQIILVGGISGGVYKSYDDWG